MKIACAQLIQDFGNPKSAFKRAEIYLRNSNADIVIFPEQYATGWRPQGFSDIDGETVKESWVSLAKTSRKCLIGSYQNRRRENCLLVCSPQGTVLAEYAKMHLFHPSDEHRYYASGKQPVLFRYGNLTFGLSICFDLRFPEIYRFYLQNACQIIIVQAMWPASRIGDWELLLRARALENRCYFIGSNGIGYDSATGTEYCGRSMVCDGDGNIVVDAGVGEGGCEWTVDENSVISEIESRRAYWMPQTSQ